MWVVSVLLLAHQAVWMEAVLWQSPSSLEEALLCTIWDQTLHFDYFSAFTRKQAPLCLSCHVTLTLDFFTNAVTTVQVTRQVNGDQALTAKVSLWHRKDNCLSKKNVSPSVPPDLEEPVGMGRHWLQREITSFLWRSWLII